MGLISRINRIIAAGTLSLGLFISCQTAKPLEDIPLTLPPLTKAEKSEAKDEAREFQNMDLFPCTRSTIAIVWNRQKEGERSGYYEITPLYKNPSKEPRLLNIKLLRIREDTDKNGLDEKDEWIWKENLKDSGYKEFLWQRDRDSSPNYFIISRDENQDTYMDRRYFYTLKNAGIIHAAFELKKIQWDRNKDNKFSKEETVWESK